MANTAPRPAPRDAPTRALLCLRGGGSSKDVFRVQLAGLRHLLMDWFEFVFVDASHHSPAGPGVLPLFAGGEPFYCWFGSGALMIESRLGSVDAAVRTAANAWTATKTSPESNMVGLVAFSEGGLAALLLLWQQQLGQLPWLLTLHFAALICCYFPDEAAEYIGGGAETRQSGERALFRVPTVHSHGRQDFCLAQARNLVAGHCEPRLVHVMEFEGGHHCPRRRQDCEEAARLILQMAPTSSGS